jgi:hypothetical protein
MGKTEAECSHLPAVVDGPGRERHLPATGVDYHVREAANRPELAETIDAETGARRRELENQ